MTIENQLKDILEVRFAPLLLHIDNQSHLHQGHTGSPDTGQSHFRIYMISSCFAHQSRLQRHQAVHKAVQPLFAQGLHALSLALYAPSDAPPEAR